MPCHIVSPYLVKSPLNLETNCVGWYKSKVLAFKSWPCQMTYEKRVTFMIQWLIIPNTIPFLCVKMPQIYWAGVEKWISVILMKLVITCHPLGFFFLLDQAISNLLQALGFALVPCMWKRDFSPLACDADLVELPQACCEVTDVWSPNLLLLYLKWIMKI